ncbi:MAG: winged helix DNA-binding domain-containing protein, partial [Myxococcales bacterium]|nr:winged helix DNA-binding domain-containing protein [Myxococcales bacterium]
MLFVGGPARRHAFVHDESMEGLTTRTAARLALARAGLLNPAWTGLPARVSPRAGAASSLPAALAHIERAGYLQLDTVAVAGARSHGIVLASRLEGYRAAHAETLLTPDSALFEYWGHEASWLPIELYPAFAFRRAAFAVHPWWGDLLEEHSQQARALVERIRAEGPLRSADIEGSSRGGFWNLKLSKKIATALWSSGELAIRERRGFLRAYDLCERVIPARARARPLPLADSLRVLLERALAGH